MAALERTAVERTAAWRGVAWRASSLAGAQPCAARVDARTVNVRRTAAALASAYTATADARPVTKASDTLPIRPTLSQPSGQVQFQALNSFLLHESFDKIALVARVLAQNPQINTPKE